VQEADGSELRVGDWPQRPSGFESRPLHLLVNDLDDPAIRSVRQESAERSMWRDLSLITGLNRIWRIVPF
jgi:hypothetical protein